jgi:hypothetical protein
MVARVLVLVAALAAVAFLVVEERAAEGADAVSRLSLRPHGTPSAADLARARDLVARARHVSPDTAPSLDLAVLQGRAGRFRAAVAGASAVAAEEPRNIRAWALIALAARPYDSGLAARARARVLSLAPPVPPAR